MSAGQAGTGRHRVIFNDIADSIASQADRAAAGVSGLFQPVVRLGVTGLSRAGKTVFITSLVANLLDRGRMPGLAARDRIMAAWLQTQPDDTVPRFEFERHLAALTGPEPFWPEGTRAVSQLRLSLRIRPGGLLSGLQGPRVVHLDIVDYPGEWLLDLELMDRDYAVWSERTLARLNGRDEGAGFLSLVSATDGAAAFEENDAQALAAAYTRVLEKMRKAGLADCTPGRFLLPGELAGSPVLTFAPLPRPSAGGRRSLWREMARRYDAYRAQVVKPFFRDHFARIDRQVVLIDVLSALHAGPEAVEDLRRAMADTLGAFRPGRNAWLTRLLLGKRVEKILFAATKADHLHHSQHPQLTAIAEALLRDARDRADFAGAETAAMAIASLRATTEEEREANGGPLPCVRGRTEAGQRAFYPGALPDDPGALLTPARQGAQSWLDAEFGAMDFLPAKGVMRPGDGPPHIRLDRAVEFLIGDRL